MDGRGLLSPFGPFRAGLTPVLIQISLVSEPQRRRQGCIAYNAFLLRRVAKAERF